MKRKGKSGVSNQYRARRPYGGKAPRIGDTCDLGCHRGVERAGHFIEPLLLVSFRSSGPCIEYPYEKKPENAKSGLAAACFSIVVH